MRTATHRAFSIPIKFAAHFETLRLSRIAKRCSIAGAPKALFNASTGSSRSCRRRLKKLFGCRLRDFRNRKLANTEGRQPHCSTAISKQRRGNRDHYGRRKLFPISNTWRKRSNQTSGRLLQLISITSPARLKRRGHKQSRGLGAAESSTRVS